MDGQRDGGDCIIFRATAASFKTDCFKSYVVLSLFSQLGMLAERAI